MPSGRATKQYRRGTHRVEAPELTLERFLPRTATFGVTRIANITGLDHVGIPVFQAIRPNARSLSVTQGKGLSDAAARASALMEAIEAFHAERIHHPLVLAGYEELVEQRSVVDVAKLPQVAGSRFRPDRRLLWIEGTELGTSEPVWLPFETVHCDYRLPLPAGSGCFPSSSNGLAAGNHRLEALVHGLCEVIERDGLAVWLAGDDQTRATRKVDLDTVDDPDCRWLLDRFESAGIAVGIWDLSTDVGVATFRVHTLDRAAGVRSRLPAHGTGCHPDRGVALCRALTEAAQSRLTYIAGSRDDADRDAYRLRQQPRTIRRSQRILADDPVRRFQDTPELRSMSLDEDLRWLLARLKAAGMRHALAVDLVDPGADYAVVRVVVPGLEALPTMPNYQPGLRATGAKRKDADAFWN